MFGDDENTDSLFDVFSGKAADVDDFDDVDMEEEEINEEEMVENTKDQAQVIAPEGVPPSATNASDNNNNNNMNKRSRPDEDQTTNDISDNDNEMEAAMKRHRAEELHAPQPIVADTFEQETSREVANIAGLQAAPATEGPQITLNHQVKGEKKKINGIGSLIGIVLYIY